jgi:DNA polymerase-4
VTLKVKYSDFRQITRAKSFTLPVCGREVIGEAGRGLLRALLPMPLGVRLLGLALSSLDRDEEHVAEQLGLGL